MRCRATPSARSRSASSSRPRTRQSARWLRSSHAAPPWPRPRSTRRPAPSRGERARSVAIAHRPDELDTAGDRRALAVSRRLQHDGRRHARGGRRAQRRQRDARPTSRETDRAPRGRVVRRLQQPTEDDVTGFSKLKKVPTGLSATYGPVSFSVSLSTEAIARSSVFADLMRQQTDAAIARMAEHLQRPMVFVHPAPKEDDGFEIRMLAWANTIAPLRYGTFLVDY